MISLALVAIVVSAEADFPQTNALLRGLGVGAAVQLNSKGSYAGVLNCAAPTPNIQILIRKFKPRKDVQPRSALDAAMLSGRPRQVELAGGMPVGEDHFCFGEDHSVGIIAIEGEFCYNCGMGAKLVKASDGPGYDQVDFDYSAMRPKLETLVRWMCAENAGRRAQQLGSANYAGHSLTTFTVDEKTVRYASISGWGSAMGWAVRTNQEAGTVYLNKGSHTVLAPVGTNAMKVDGKWIRTRGVTFYKNGTYYADVANLP